MGNEEMRHSQTTREWRILLGHKFLANRLFSQGKSCLLHKEMARPAGLEPATVGLEDAFSGYNSVYPRIVTPV